MIKKIVFPMMAGTGFILLSHSALALELNYAHKYEDISRQHTDELEISHDFESGVGLGVKLKFHPQEKANGDAGDAFDRRKINEKEFKLNYTRDLTDKLSIEPGMVFALKSNEQKYKPSIKFKYRLFDKTQLSLRYRKEISDRDAKPTKRVDKVEGKISQKINNFKFSYTLIWYHGNENLYNNKRQDVEHKVEVAYQLTQHFSPYIGVKNEAVSKSDSARQTEFITGITYEF
ncbi:oligogalacturonate-specific porin KdgM family protein [Klebsiella indica]|uniref:Porin n=1 Tax=Klebsiella indica TaxID=2582917 RepID=A0A5R9L931_9ENTR|nr:oligogalacturonate-specific porin KdgM family protein [Klebsiella indica]TLV05547.1 hypothetical protein FE839_22875 [Klebsiella indica]